jgi:hypothetical protein
MLASLFVLENIETARSTQYPDLAKTLGPSSDYNYGEARNGRRSIFEHLAYPTF